MYIVLYLFRVRLPHRVDYYQQLHSYRLKMLLNGSRRWIRPMALLTRSERLRPWGLTTAKGVDLALMKGFRADQENIFSQKVIATYNIPSDLLLITRLSVTRSAIAIELN